MTVATREPANVPAGRQPTTPFSICFVAPGSNIHTMRWVNAMSARGHRVLLISQEPALGVDAEVFDPYEGMGFLGRLPKIRALVAERRILHRIRTFSPDVVHFHWLNPTLGTLRLARRVHPLVVSVWGSDLIWDGGRPEPRMRAYCKSRILDRASEVTATSTFLADRTRRWLGPGRQPIVVPFGVDCARFSPLSPRADRPVPVIGYLKHYKPKYGADVLLRAVSLLLRDGLEFRVEMYGWGNAEPYVRLSRELALGDRVRIAGGLQHDRVPEAMRQFDIYAMPSIYQSETFGVAALEAAACGVPVVASRIGGVPETVLEGVTGLLVNPSDPEDLARALGRLLRDRTLRHGLGDAGRDFVVRSYRWETCVDRMEDMYARVVRPRPRDETGRNSMEPARKG